MSNTEKTMVILWIAISFILSASGQTNYIFRNINIQHGLPDNQIKGLFFISGWKNRNKNCCLTCF